MTLEEEITQAIYMHGPSDINTIMRLVFKYRMPTSYDPPKIQKQQKKSTFKKAMCDMDNIYSYPVKVNGKYIWKWRLTFKTRLKLNIEGMKLWIRVKSRMRIK